MNIIDIRLLDLLHQQYFQSFSQLYQLIDESVRTLEATVSLFPDFEAKQ
jgi:hypothetical protein